MVKLEILLNKLEDKINDLEKNSDIEKSIALYKKGQKIINKCKNKIEQLDENIEQIEQTEQTEQYDISQIMARMVEINSELSNPEIYIEDSIKLYNESKLLEKQFTNFFGNGQMEVKTISS